MSRGFSYKIPMLSQRKGLEIPWGWGFSKAQKFK